MAKKKFGLSSTLSKNKEEATLPKKVPLTKSSKDLNDVKEKVEALHSEKPVEVIEVPKAEEKSIPESLATEIEVEAAALSVPSIEEVKEEVVKVKKAAPKKKAEKKPERMVRITVDTPKSMHVRLKIKAIEEDITIRDYVIGLIKKDLGIK